MKANESGTDRVIRIIVGIILIILGWMALGNNVLGIILDIIGVILVTTGITGVCGLYKLLGMSTKKKEPSA